MSQPSPVKGRNLWPAGIVAAFVIFVAGTAGLVVFSARNNVELVSADYYERELRFQEQINRHKRTRTLAEPVRVTYDAAQRQVMLFLPPAHAAAQAQGEIQLYRPSAAGLDRRVALALDAHGQQTFDASTLSDGLWRVRVLWRVGGEEFTCDEKVVIRKPKPS